MRLTLEHGVFAAGLCLACASASFAAYKISTNTGIPALPAVLPKGELMAWKRGIPSASPTPDADPTTTGSISAAWRAAQRSLPPATAEGALPPGQNAPDANAGGPEYVLVEVANNTAVVRVGGELRHVRQGAVLPGLGRINAIERIGGEWIVLTSAAVLRERR